MGGGKVAVLIMLVVAVVVMVGGADAASSSLTTPNILDECLLQCTRGCLQPACIAACVSRCVLGVKVGGAAGDAASSLPASPAASSSSLTTPNNLDDFPSCLLECTRGCLQPVCSEACLVKCAWGVKVGGAAGDASSSLPTSPAASWSLPASPAADYARCANNCQDNDRTLPFGIPNPVCKAACLVKYWPYSTADDHRRFCNLGCLSSKCSSLIPNSGRVDRHDEAAVQDCARSCADTCSPSSTKKGLGQGRDQVV